MTTRLDADGASRAHGSLPISTRFHMARSRMLWPSCEPRNWPHYTPDGRSKGGPRAPFRARTQKRPKKGAISCLNILNWLRGPDSIETCKLSQIISTFSEIISAWSVVSQLGHPPEGTTDRFGTGSVQATFSTFPVEAAVKMNCTRRSQ